MKIALAVAAFLFVFAAHAQSPDAAPSAQPVQDSNAAQAPDTSTASAPVQQPQATPDAPTVAEPTETPPRRQPAQPQAHPAVATIAGGVIGGTVGLVGGGLLFSLIPQDGPYAGVQRILMIGLGAGVGLLAGTLLGAHIGNAYAQKPAPQLAFEITPRAGGLDFSVGLQGRF